MDPTSVAIGVVVGNFITLWILFMTRSAWLPVVRVMLTGAR